MSYVDQLERELVRAGQARRRHRPRVTLGGVTVTAAAALSLALAVLALAALHRGPAQPPAAPSAIPAAARTLVSQLAVLRRPQTATDRTLPQQKLPSLIPDLTRLAIDTGALKVWVVVVDARAAGSHSPWPVGFGDQVALVARVDGQTYLTLPLPAAGLRDPTVARNAGGWIVQLVPDGVAKAAWSFPVKTGTYTAYGSVINNVAFTHLGPAAIAPTASAKWFAANGHRVPTTPQALSRLLKLRRRAEALSAKSAAANTTFSIPPAVVRELPRAETASGITVAAPGVARLPLPILKMALGGRARIAASYILSVSTRAGVTFWVAPGQNGLCVFGQDTPNGGFGTCSPTLQTALTEGVWTDVRAANGQNMRVGVVARSDRSVTFHLKGGGSRTVAITDGVVVTPDAGTITRVQVNR